MRGHPVVGLRTKTLVVVVLGFALLALFGVILESFEFSFQRSRAPEFLPVTTVEQAGEAASSLNTCSTHPYASAREMLTGLRAPRELCMSQYKPKPVIREVPLGSPHDDFSTESDSFADYKIAVCSVVKNTRLTIREWIMYHLMIGVDHIFLYDNNAFGEDLDEDHLQALLYPFFFSYQVTIIPWRRDKNLNNFDQNDAFEDCAHNQAQNFDWVASIDYDEYITVEGANDLKCVHMVLRERLHAWGMGSATRTPAAQLRMLWKIGFNSDQFLHPPLVMASASEVCLHPNTQDFTKSFYRPATINSCLVHRCSTKPSLFPPEEMRTEDNFKHESHFEMSPDISLYHFSHTSVEEYLDKMDTRVWTVPPTGPNDQATTTMNYIDLTVWSSRLTISCCLTSCVAPDPRREGSQLMQFKEEMSAVMAWLERCFPPPPRERHQRPNKPRIAFRSDEAYHKYTEGKAHALAGDVFDSEAFIQRYNWTVDLPGKPLPPMLIYYTASPKLELRGAWRSPEGEVAFGMIAAEAVEAGFGAPPPPLPLESRQGASPPTTTTSANVDAAAAAAAVPASTVESAVAAALERAAAAEAAAAESARAPSTGGSAAASSPPPPGGGAGGGGGASAAVEAAVAAALEKEAVKSGSEAVASPTTPPPPPQDITPPPPPAAAAVDSP